MNDTLTAFAAETRQHQLDAAGRGTVIFSASAASTLAAIIALGVIPGHLSLWLMIVGTVMGLLFPVSVAGAVWCHLKFLRLLK